MEEILKTMLELEETKLSHYAIQRRLARGGMSDIYLAHDEQKQTVVMKVVHSSQEDYVAHFQREVKTLQTLTHEHILPILDCGKDGAWHYCVMPYMSYGTLRDRLRKKPLSVAEASSIFEQIARALQHAHEQGVLHRDIKPSNILLGDDAHVYLADFGLAKEIAEEDGDFTQVGCLIGTPEYMAPELADQPASVSSDIYALGIVLYQMLTGQVPFKGANPVSIYWKHIQEQPVPPSQLNPAISYSVEQVILCALEKEPARRFKSVQSMAEAYARALDFSGEVSLGQSQAISSDPDRVTLPPPSQRVIALKAVQARRSFHPALIALVATFFLLVVPFTLGFSFSISSSSMHAPTVLGASEQFVKIDGLTQGRTPTATATPTTTTTTVTTSTSIQLYSQLTGDGGQNHGGHGHKHGHKHKHGHGDL